MSKAKSSHPHLVKMVQHMVRISSYLSETSQDEFFAKRLNYDAIMKQTDLLGEIVSQLVHDDPDNITKKFNEIPWAEVRAIRNRSSHNYFSIDPNIIWKYVTEELPDIEAGIRNILAKRYRTTQVEDYS
ncbi:MAG TPA: HepT-like ribonuclease domain-containing protein [Oligoflexus sp.]|uniref:HepT-like ribonuclease domain-containing protein n=1 Tax=Oligoflexus sp. TaxID=1971216 RepID=UPI002D4813CC|nr:HepT-like ribonuclease domain-containing protein [Oligoflexus sp.]HYX38454.1 HepT-like ribonuclease domain-containing protein [Oligoflexus sp.]